MTNPTSFSTAASRSLTGTISWLTFWSCSCRWLRWQSEWESPWLLGLAGLAGGKAMLSLIGLPVLGLGVGSFIKTVLIYRGDYFAPLAVAGLLHKVKVSNVRPVPARVRGTIIGKGVPGLIWSEDFVMRDATGILFLDYRQPLRIWEWLFGLFRAGEFAGKPVEAIGWFRRAPLPYLELKSITVDGVDAQQLRPPRPVCRRDSARGGRHRSDRNRVPGWMSNSGLRMPGNRATA